MNLRRWITALAVLAVFTAVASAQITPATQVTCTVSAATNPAIRSEGANERVGDLVLTCTGGLAFAAGTAADRMTIVVDYGVAVTSQADTTAGNTSAIEAAILIDNPGTLSAAGATALGITGYGPNAAITPCFYSGQLNTTGAAAQTACPDYAATSGGYIVSAVASPATGVTAANAYQGVVGNGVVTGSKVTFNNVPLIPPSASGVQRVYRIVNVRVNPGGTGTVNATVTSATLAAGSASTIVATGSAPVASSAASLTTSVVASPVSACVTTTLVNSATTAKANVALLKFSQNFAGAFKTRAIAQDAGPDFGYAAGALQTSSVGSYTVGTATVSNTSESGVKINFGGSLTSAGIAAAGTRLKAVFTGLDTKVTNYYVSLYPVTDYANEILSPTVAAGGVIGDTQQIDYAVLQSAGTAAVAVSETAGYTAAAGTGVANAGSGGVPAGVNVAALNVTVASGVGKAEVVWEISNMKAAAADTYAFALYAVYSSVAPPSTAPTTAAAVQLGYAPTNSSTAPGSTSAIPRFAAPGAAGPFFTALPCQTTLLYPFLTNIGATATSTGAPSGAHWETGFSIANTGSDPLGTVPAAAGGTCTLNFYGSTYGGGSVSTPPPAITIGPILPGSSYAATVSNPALASPPPAYAPFEGYMFAVCNFNYGHGFAFVIDNTSQLSMGYLAEVLNSTTDNVQRGSFTLGETLEN